MNAARTTRTGQKIVSAIRNGVKAHVAKIAPASDFASMTDFREENFTHYEKSGKKSENSAETSKPGCKIFVIQDIPYESVVLS